MKVLAVDFGDRRVGLAASDELGFVHGLPTVEMASPRKAANEVVRIAGERAVERIVVGLPRNMDGTLGPRADTTLAFCELLRRRTKLPVDTYDERLTSTMARQVLRATGLDERNARGHVDRVAAAIILRDYLVARTPGRDGEDVAERQ